MSGLRLPVPDSPLIPVPPDPRAERRQAVEEAFAVILSNSADLAPEALAAQATEFAGATGVVPRRLETLLPAGLCPLRPRCFRAGANPCISAAMTLITDTDRLTALCRDLARESYVTVDTEFMREKTYWAKLCLVQLAGSRKAAAVDPLAPGLDLSPLYELLADGRVLKVFHAARQDIEIFYHLTSAVPAPLFDTQVAAMVCGFGDSVAYETLVARLTDAHIDKLARFTDWSLRPLTETQLNYALADVTHMRAAYEELARRLARSGRKSWLEAEMAVLTDPTTYRLDPREAWRRLKTRSGKPQFLAVLREVAAWRETEARRRDVPRGWVLRDEILLEIARHAPKTVDALARTRGLPRRFAEGRAGAELLAAVRRGLAVPESERPKPSLKVESAQGLGSVVDLLKVLLKMKCEAHEVASKLVASVEDLELIAADDNAPVPALRGWRRELFGADALGLKHGKLALMVEGRRLALVPLADPRPARASTRA